MERISIDPRENWQRKCEAVGFTFHDTGGLYWNESACYHFIEAEIEELEAATQSLHEMCLEAVECVIEEERFEQLCIPPEFAQLCRQSWEKDEPTLYGRFDLAYDGQNPPKLLEYNADTPTTLLEASIVQWTWLEEVYPEADQFNSIHENLLQTFQEIDFFKRKKIYFSCVKDSQEDLVTIEYLRDVAIQAGLETEEIFIEDIGWSETAKVFCDLEEEIIKVMFKLYPWEWLIKEPFGDYLLLDTVTLIEPAWKMILSNKAILPILWELFPDHPNLLPAYYDRFSLSHPYVSKPIFSREGENITIHHRDHHYKTSGMYEDEPLIYQAYFPLPQFDGFYPAIGSWIIGDRAAGIGIREDRSPITQNTSYFVPHYFD